MWTSLCLIQETVLFPKLRTRQLKYADFPKQIKIKRVYHFYYIYFSSLSSSRRLSPTFFFASLPLDMRDFECLMTLPRLKSAKLVAIDYFCFTYESRHVLERLRIEVRLGDYWRRRRALVVEHLESPQVVQSCEIFIDDGVMETTISEFCDEYKIIFYAFSIRRVLMKMDTLTQNVNYNYP